MCFAALVRMKPLQNFFQSLPSLFSVLNDLQVNKLLIIMENNFVSIKIDWMTDRRLVLYFLVKWNKWKTCVNIFWSFSSFLLSNIKLRFDKSLSKNDMSSCCYSCGQNISPFVSRFQLGNFMVCGALWGMFSCCSESLLCNNDFFKNF